MADFAFYAQIRTTLGVLTISGLGFVWLLNVGLFLGSLGAAESLFQWVDFCAEVAMFFKVNNCYLSYSLVVWVN